jgi:hypothetical protein
VDWVADYVRAGVAGAGFEGWIEATSTAACVRFDPVPTLRWVESDPPPMDSTDDKQDRVACPPGTTPHAGGVAINSRIIDQVGVHVGASQLDVTSDIYAIARENITATDKVWELFTTGTCA